MISDRDTANKLHSFMNDFCDTLSRLGFIHKEYNVPAMMACDLMYYWSNKRYYGSDWYG